MQNVSLVSLSASCAFKVKYSSILLVKEKKKKKKNGDDCNCANFLRAVSVPSVSDRTDFLDILLVNLAFEKRLKSNFLFSSQNGHGKAASERPLWVALGLIFSFLFLSLFVFPQCDIKTKQRRAQTATQLRAASSPRRWKAFYCFQWGSHELLSFVNFFSNSCCCCGKPCTASVPFCAGVHSVAGQRWAEPLQRLLVAFLDLFIAYFSLGCLCLHFEENWKEWESKVKPMVLTSAFENKIHSTLCE